MRIASTMFVICCVLMPTVCLASSPRAKSFTKFEDAIAGLSSQITKYIKADSASGGAIIIEDDAFDGPGSGGPKIARALRLHLEKNLKIIRVNGYSIKGDYSLGEVDGKFVMHISAKVKDTFGNVVSEKNKRVRSDDPIAIELRDDVEAAVEIAGLTVDATQQQNPVEAEEAPSLEAAATKPSADPDFIEEQVTNAFKEPQETTIALTKPGKSPNGQQTVLRFSDDSPYGIEVVKQALANDLYNQVCEIEMRGGVATVPLEIFDVFAIRIHNDSKKKVGISVLLDGINRFEFCEIPHFKAQGKAICFPSSRSDVTGWYINKKDLRKFVMASREQGAAARLNRASGVGTITVIFYEAIPSLNGRGVTPGVSAIGVGEKIKNTGGTTNDAFGKMLGSVSVRYFSNGHPEDLPPG